jgi:hypothetical protein
MTTAAGAWHPLVGTPNLSPWRCPSVTKVGGSPLQILDLVEETAWTLKRGWLSPTGRNFFFVESSSKLPRRPAGRLCVFLSHQVPPFIWGLFGLVL